MRIGDKVRKMVKKWLDIQPAGDRHIVIKEPMSFETNVLKNLLWYRGEAEELEQFFMAAATTTVAQQRFWAASYAAERIRKIHSGLPAMIADVLSQSVSADVQNITIEEEEVEINEEGELVNIIFVGTRENFYDELKRYFNL